MKKQTLDIKYLDIPIDKDGIFYSVKVKLNTTLRNLIRKVKELDNKNFVYEYCDVTFTCKYGSLTISNNCIPYIDNCRIWMRPDTKYLKFYYSERHRNLNKQKICNIIREFNKILIPCCNQIRLCKKCLTRARSVITY